MSAQNPQQTRDPGEAGKLATPSKSHEVVHIYGTNLVGGREMRPLRVMTLGCDASSFAFPGFARPALTATAGSVHVALPSDTLSHSAAAANLTGTSVFE
ncbi:hypothetical protein MY11210_007559 [Beauveria gryllotalpidicola]